MLTTTPPYAVEPPAFAFRALAAQLGRAPLGGPRECVLACLLAARLAAALRPPLELEGFVRRARATSARGVLSTLALAAPVREAVLRVLDASAEDDPAAAADAVRALGATCADVLEPAAGAELEALARLLDG